MKLPPYEIPEQDADLGVVASYWQSVRCYPRDRCRRCRSRRAR